MTFHPGDDVIVLFDGLEHIGHVEIIEHGFVRVRFRIDPTADYGPQTPRLGIESVVMVRPSDVRHADPTSTK